MSSGFSSFSLTGICTGEGAQHGVTRGCSSESWSSEGPWTCRSAEAKAPAGQPSLRRALQAAPRPHGQRLQVPPCPPEPALPCTERVPQSCPGQHAEGPAAPAHAQPCPALSQAHLLRPGPKLALGSQQGCPPWPARAPGDPHGDSSKCGNSPPAHTGTSAPNRLVHQSPRYGTSPPLPAVPMGATLSWDPGASPGRVPGLVVPLGSRSSGYSTR